MSSSIDGLAVVAQPWVVLAKPFCWRGGARGLVQASAHGSSRLLLSFRVSGFVKAGCVGLNDVLPFLETMSGHELMNTSMHLADFRAGAGSVGMWRYLLGALLACAGWWCRPGGGLCVWGGGGSVGARFKVRCAS